MPYPLRNRRIILRPPVSSTTPPPGGITLVQHKEVHPSGGTGSLTGLTATTAGDSMVVFVSFQDPSNTITSMTDNAGGGSSTYTQVPGVYTNMTDGSFSAIDAFFCSSLNAGATTITAAASGTGVQGVFALQVRGLASKAVDVTNHIYNTGNNTSLTSPSITTTVANEFLACFCLGQGSTSQGLDPTEAVYTIADSAPLRHGNSAYAIVSSTGTYAAKWVQVDAAEFGIISLGLK